MRERTQSKLLRHILVWLIKNCALADAADE